MNISKEAKIRHGLSQWFHRCMAHQLMRKKTSPIPFGTYYEFGVGWGGTLRTYFDALEKFCEKFEKKPSDFRIHTFDSFEGLPESTHTADQHPSWGKGKLAYSIDYIKEMLNQYPFSQSFENISFTKGFFENSLTEELQKKLAAHPPGIVTIDVDFYTSTKEVLQWLRPIMMSGTNIFFEDFWSFHGHPDYGQVRAIKEFNAENDGHLVPTYAMNGCAYVYTRKDYEY